MGSNPIRATMDISEKFELPKSSLPPVTDQGELGSSTAHAVAYAIIASNRSFQGEEPRLLLYYSEREIAG